MAKPNETCPCLSGKKYKKCCKKKGLFTKKADDIPSLWKNLGESHSSLRFAVGDRIEGRVGEKDSNGEDKWTPSTIRNLNIVYGDGRRYPYQCLLDYPVNGGRLVNIPQDINACIRPLGYTKSLTNIQNCGKCGVHESVEGVELLNCSGCRRTRYCCIEHLHADRKNHKVFCRAIIKEKKRYKMEINDIIKTGKAEAVNIALNNAANGGNLLVVKKLFKKRGGDIDVNALDSDGFTALYHSSYNGHIGITTFLLETEGIDVNKPETKYGATPLCAASQNGHVEIVTMLLGAEGIKVNKSNIHGATPLFKASQNNQIEIVKLLLGSEGIEINQPANDGVTPLFIASQQGHVKIVKLLLGAEGINVNETNVNGATPLIEASLQGHVEIVKLLLGAEGIKVNKSEIQGATPLYVALQMNQIEIIKILLSAEGIKVNQPRNDGATPLIMASQNNQIEIVKLLLGAEGIEINKPANNGATPLAMAKQKNNTEIFQLLTAAGATQ